MAKRKSAKQIKDEIEALQKQMQGIEIGEEARAGRLLRKAGVLSLELSEDELLKAFEKLAVSFRTSGSKAGRESTSEKPEARTAENVTQ